MFKDEFIKESDKAEHLISNEAICDEFSEVIKNQPTPALISIVGAYGSGKSMMLNRIRDDHYIENSKWILFDAWKYPDRSALWEGFVLDFAENIGELSEYENKIDGNSNSSKVADVTSDVLSAAGALVPSLSNVGDLLKKLFESNPVTRISGLQKLLVKLINKELDNGIKHLIIVIEDIDRSDDYGINFLETFRHFVDHSEIRDKKLTVIAPIGTEPNIRSHPSYIKCFDITYEYQLKNVGLSRFVHRALDMDNLSLINFYDAIPNRQRLKDDGREMIIQFLNRLVKLYANDFNPRELKSLLRQANRRHRDLTSKGLSPDYRFDLCIEIMKVIPYKVPSEDNKSAYEDFILSKEVRSESYQGRFFANIMCDIFSGRHIDYDQRDDRFIPAISIDSFDGISPLYWCKHTDDKFLIDERYIL